MSPDETAEKTAELYSKKWGVPMDEAKRKVQAFLDKKPSKKENGEEEDRSKLVPGLGEDLFPKPLGEISRKVQDINQAALSTAYTRRMLRAPPDEIEEIKGNVNSLYTIIGEFKNNTESQIKTLTDMMDEKQRQETRAALFQELNQSIDPLKKDLETVKERLMRGGEGGTVAEPKQYFEKARTVTEEAKGLLEQAGYKVTSGQVSREEVEKMIAEVGKRSLEEIPTEKLKERLEAAGYKVEPVKLSREEVERMIAEGQKKVLETTTSEVFKKRLEAEGYKIVGGPLTYPQVEEMLKQERQKGQEEVLDDKRIVAVENIIHDSVRDLIALFKPAVDYYFEATLKGGAPPPESSISPEKVAKGS